ncbi:MAG: glycoside hydrolase 43 family protein [Bacteroidales bacterium]|nr:glycoside hydrolase 43 family protein [Bacteroidales bacterium]
MASFRSFVALLGILACPLSWAQQPYRSSVWCPDNGDGTYTNPVIYADYSDPDVCVGASGHDFYLTASSFNCIPGLPILHSRDLVNWQLVNHAVKALPPYDRYATPQHGNGVWAPSIRYNQHNQTYYIYWGDPDLGVFVVTAKDPLGSWSEPQCIIEGKGMIDTTPLWDDDGRCYLVNGWANSRCQFNSVLTVREMSADGLRPIGQPVIVFDGNGTENRTAEGPKFYKRDGWYWIFCPAGGVPTGHQLAMRSRSPFGPYEWQKVLEQGKTTVNGPHQGGWVHLPSGQDWFLHFQDMEAYGRVVWLEPMQWVDNWPVMGRKTSKYCGEPVLSHAKPQVAATSPICNPVENDEFSAPVLGPQWQWHANYDQTFGMPTAFGSYRLFCHQQDSHWRNHWQTPNLLLQKTPAPNFTATTRFTFSAKEEGQSGGIICMGLDYASLIVKRVGNAFQVQQVVCPKADKGTPEEATVLATLAPTSADAVDYQPALHLTLFMRLSVQYLGGVDELGQNLHKAQVTFSFSSDGKHWTPAPKPFTMRQGKWIGAKVGYVASEPSGLKVRGWLDADWWRITTLK